MSGRIAYPFLTLSEMAVDASPWMIAQGNGPLEEISDFLSDWDYTAPLHVRRSLRLNREIAASELEIAQGELALGAGLVVGTGPGRLPRSIVHQVKLEWPSSDQALDISMDIPGEVLSSVLHLRLDVLLLREPNGGSDLAPRRLGDRLWRDDTRTRLEGEEPRFPIEVADFAYLLGDLPAAQSPWYLHWSPHQWSRDFHGSIRLYLNAAHRDLIASIEAEDGATLRFLMADVMGQVCESLVRDADVEGVVEHCEEGSLGAQAAHWLRLAFPRQDISEVRSVLEKRPGIFRASFQAVAELKRDEA